MSPLVDAEAEALEKIQRQAAVLLLREARPGYILPVGVWNVRESVRAALRTKPSTFHTFQQALQHACNNFITPQQTWIRNSTLIREELFQQRLNQYFAS